MPLIWDDIVRVTINGTYGPRPWANVLDIELDLGISGADREDECFALAGDVLDNWDDHIRPFMVNSCICTSVSWVDLNSADGSTGSRSSTSANTWPSGGGIATPGWPPQTSALVTKVAPGGGRRTRNGLLYLTGLSEASTDTTSIAALTAAAQLAINSGFDSFQSGINGESGPVTGVTRQIGVLRTRREDDGEGNMVQVATGFNEVTDMVAQVLVATQRQRVRP